MTRFVYQFLTSEAEKLKLMQYPKAASQWQEGSWIQNLDVKHLIPSRFYLFQKSRTKIEELLCNECIKLPPYDRIAAEDVLGALCPGATNAGSSIRAALAGLVWYVNIYLLID